MRKQTFAGAVLNPPFAAEGRPLAWLDHVEHAIRWLKPGGQLAAILPASVSFRDKHARIVALRTLATRTGGIEPLPDGTFSGSDTEVRTVMLWLRKED
jgi:hypothetical protein